MNVARDSRWWLVVGAALFSGCSNGNNPPDGGGSPDSGLDGGTVLDDGGLDSGLTIAETQLAAGTPCAGNQQCQSGICGLAGTGHCCASQCVAVDQGQGCGANDCDGLGECFYPGAGAACGQPQCQGAGLEQGSCNGLGMCVAGAPQACGGHFGCANALACAATCRGDDAGTLCAPGYYCDPVNDTCIPKARNGFCEEGSVCASGVCLGHTCCVQSCLTGDTFCGAKSCDLESGACNYAPSSQYCGPLQSCTGDQLTSDRCDGAGNCGSSSIAACVGNFACLSDGGLCNTTCASNAQCASQLFCDPLGGCCPNIAPGSSVLVDAIYGTDSACCGGPQNPCNSLSFAMKEVAGSKAQGAVLQAVQLDLGNQYYGAVEWHPVGLPLGEPYPVHLGWGVTLTGASISFNPPTNTDAFDVYRYPGEPDGGTVTIAGVHVAATNSVPAVENPLFIGFELSTENGGIANGANIPPNLGVTAINADFPDPEPLQLSEVVAVGAARAVAVGPGGSLLLGPNPVTIGFRQFGPLVLPLSNPAIGGDGVVCHGTAAAPASVRDLDAGGAPVVWTSGQLGNAFSIGEYCNVSLTQSPQIGAESLDLGVGLQSGSCSTEQDEILMTGPSQLTLGSLSPTAPAPSALGCGLKSNLELRATDAGSPTANLIGVEVLSGVCQGVLLNGGQLTAVASRFSGNHVGVYQMSGKVDLHANPTESDGGFPNEITCEVSSGIPLGTTSASCPSAGIGPSVGVVTDAPSSVNLDNVAFTYWDSTANAPETWTCDSTYSVCNCNDPAICPNAPGGFNDGVTAARSSSGSAPVTDVLVIGNRNPSPPSSAGSSATTNCP